MPAYSTLGWFDDPLLNTFMRYPELEIARLIFHELGHQVVYVKDDSTFNESFATTVEEEGLRRWMAGHATPEQKTRYEQFPQSPRAGDGAAAPPPATSSAAVCKRAAGRCRPSAAGEAVHSMKCAPNTRG